MPQIRKIVRMGTSLGVTLHPRVLTYLGLHRGDLVYIDVVNGHLQLWKIPAQDLLPPGLSEGLDTPPAAAAGKSGGA
jgi:antitoxin component of MazEF toxin-antitoxin module